MQRLYAFHCGRSVEEVEKALDRDHYMTPEEAREWGLIDQIHTRREGLPPLEAMAMSRIDGAAPRHA
jgi:ATP-dependent Clp protease protease subunit